jgi:hypothetical protein
MDSLSMGLTFSCHPFGLGTSDLRQDILASAPYIFSAFIHRLKSVVFCRFQIKEHESWHRELSKRKIIVISDEERKRGEERLRRIIEMMRELGRNG